MDEKAENELKKLQKHYVLKDEDVLRLEKEQEVEHQKRQAEKLPQELQPEKLPQELQAKLFTEKLGNGVVLEMVAIPGGKFLMGSPESELERYSSESPQHTVTVRLKSYMVRQVYLVENLWKNSDNFPQGNYT
ncbi:MAG: hypothetical protein V7K90_02170 [Nostoc sp.]|uniref:hypothetical protein n=1 Tax=Nostoc sp. TaxID=1180 RepID=UPI002FFA9D3A